MVKTLTSWLESFDEETVKAIKQAIPDDKLLDLFFSKKISIESLASKISWKSFEKLTELMFNQIGYSTLTNFRIKRKEIDVIAYKQDLVFAADCKHWKRMSASSLRKSVEAQKMRASLLLSTLTFSKKQIIPLIVTLYESELKIIDYIPIVPIFKLKDFVIDIYGYMELITVIKGP
ncbi:MAG: restriction endonuclease [Nitrososphaeria archaeon]